jgi:hypothetical protein
MVEAEETAHTVVDGKAVEVLVLEALEVHPLLSQD